MRGEHKRIFYAFLRSQFFAVREDSQIREPAQVVLFDLLVAAQQSAREPSRQGGFANSFGTGEEDRLRDALLLDHLRERGDRLCIAVELLKHDGRPPRCWLQWRRDPREWP